MITTTVTGNIGQDAQQKGDWAEFTVASTDKVKGEKVTTWVRCSIWGKRGASLLPYLTKGTRVCVVGTLTARAYTSQGEARVGLDVRVDQIDLMGGGDRREQHAPPAADSGELPF